MRRIMFTTLLLVCGAITVCLAAINALDGKWSATLKPGDGSEISVTYTFKTDGNKFTGNVAFPGNDFPISDGVIKGDSISFKVSFNGNDIPNNGRLYADSIGLDISLNGKKYHNTLKRDK